MVVRAQGQGQDRLSASLLMLLQPGQHLCPADVLHSQEKGVIAKQSHTNEPVHQDELVRINLGTKGDSHP